MGENKRIGDYEADFINSGRDTDVYRTRRSGTERYKGIVLKNLAGIDITLGQHKGWVCGEDGFDENYKQLVEDHLNRLKATYGEFMLGMRIIKNPENPKLYLIAQEYIDLADPDDIGNYRPEDLTEPQLQASILRLVESLKYNLRQFNSGQAYILPDIEEGNFVLTKDRDRLVYLDSGTYQSNEINAQKILYIARLAMLGGQTAEQIKADPFFKKTLENQELNNVPNHELYQVILAKENQLRINPDEIPTEIE